MAQKKIEHNVALLCVYIFHVTDPMPLHIQVAFQNELKPGTPFWEGQDKWYI